MTLTHQIVMIHLATILHELLTLRKHWTCVEENKKLWTKNEILRWSYISYEFGHYW